MTLTARPFLLLLTCALLAACAPGESARHIPLPTLVPSAPPALDDAQRAALNFLEAWRSGDYATMHGLITRAAQDATPFDDFQARYEQVRVEMTLQALSYQPVAMAAQGSQLVVLNYDVTFSTQLFGDFSDTGRSLNLVFDPYSGGWRVAWSPGDLFAEMGGGAALRLERSIPLRANIRDRNGEMLADQNGNVVVISIIRQNVPDLPACLALLAQATGQPDAVIQARLDAAGAGWLTEIGTMEPQVYTQMLDPLTQTCAAQFTPRAARRYLNGSLAPHVLGAVGYPTADQIPAFEAAGFTRESILGQSGIELSWDPVLRGSPGGRLALIARDGTRLRVLAEATPQPGQSVWLTLDYGLQQFALQAIGESYAVNVVTDKGDTGWAPGSNGAAAVVLDVTTGAILALVSFPTYDANAYVPFPAIGQAAAADQQRAVQDDPRQPLVNRATMGAYPAGSVFKIVDVVAVADSGIHPTDEVYVCGGIWQRETNFTRYDWLPQGHGRVTLSSALTQSCNPFFYEMGYVAYQRDPFLIANYARRLGLGAPTGLDDLPGLPGVIPDPDWLRITYGQTWTMSDAVNMAIGQGYVQVTPLHIAQMVSALANGGTLYRPQLVAQTGLLGGVPSYTLTPEVLSTLNLSPDALALVRAAMCSVTTETSGTAYYVFRDSPLQTLGVCGKTGTAQSGGADQPPHAWFTAYAPRDNPRIAVAVIVENSGEGSAVAAPIVRRILEYYFFGTG